MSDTWVPWVGLGEALFIVGMLVAVRLWAMRHPPSA